MSETGNINITGNVTGEIINIGGNQTIHLAPKPRTCPPPPENPAQFGGRDKPLETLLAKLKAGDDCVITAVQGMGGMGKTTLAKVLANRLYEEKVFRAVLWTEITRQPDVMRLLRGWASHADSTFDTANQPEQQIAWRVKALLEEVIAEKCQECDPPRVLVVLDDVWDNGLSTVDLLRKACPAQSTILITTRSTKVANKFAPGDAEPLNKMQADEAVSLLRSHLGRKPDEAALRTLGLSLGGHPLALALAAQRILNEQGRSGQSLESTLARCTQDYQQKIPAGTSFAELEMEQGESKDENLTTSLYYSYEDLNADDQARFRALGILAHDVPFHTGMLAALWQVEPEAIDKACDRLRLLALIEPDPATGAGWYRQHPLLRSLAISLLKKHAETEDVFGRYADYMTVVAEQFDKLPQENWTVLDPYLPHINLMGDELVSQYQKHPEVEILQKRLGDFSWNVKYYVEHRPEIISTERGNFRRGLSWLEAGLSVYQQQNDLFKVDSTLHNIGNIYSDLGEKKKALKFLEQSINLAQSTDDLYSQATTLNSIGEIYRSLGEDDKAFNYFNRALPLSRSSGDLDLKATILHNIGVTYFARNELQKALDHINLALSIIHKTANKSHEARSLTSMGEIYRSLGNHRLSLKCFTKALNLNRAIDDKANEATAHNGISWLYMESGDFERAATIQEEVILIWKKIGGAAFEAESHMTLGLALHKLKRFSESITHVSQAIVILKQYNLPQAAGGTTLPTMEAFLARLQQTKNARDNS